MQNLNTLKNMIMKKLTLLFLTMCLPVLIYAQSKFPQKGKIEVQTMKSIVLNVERNYSIYLPKSYTTNPERKYPILYLLHGMSDNNTGWSKRGHIEDVANQVIDADDACEMIIVTPDAGTDWNGYFDMNGWKYETYFFTEFMPYIESTYRVIADKEHRAIAGLSMGGGATTAYAEKHPELFSSAYAMSALMMLPEGRAVSAKDKKVEELNKSVISNDCVKFIASANDTTKEKLRTVRWFVDCGDDDFLFDTNLAFFMEMKKANIPCQLRVRDGGHTWEYWHSALYTALPFVSRGFAK